MYMFGSGVMTVTPQSNGSISGQTPINIGLLQKGTITAKSTTKTLFGQYRDPLAVGAGTRTWSGKAEVARFSARVLSAIYFGGTPASGSTQTAYESHTVPATGPFTVTTTNSANYTTDLGVVYAATGLPLTEVASVTAIGQYSVSAGVYTFDSADASAGVIIAYNW